jgi:hypothetical protein
MRLAGRACPAAPSRPPLFDPILDKRHFVRDVGDRQAPHERAGRHPHEYRSLRHTECYRQNGPEKRREKWRCQERNAYDPEFTPDVDGNPVGFREFFGWRFPVFLNEITDRATYVCEHEHTEHHPDRRAKRGLYPGQFKHNPRNRPSEEFQCTGKRNGQVF